MTNDLGILAFPLRRPLYAKSLQEKRAWVFANVHRDFVSVTSYCKQMSLVYLEQPAYIYKEQFAG